VSPLSAGNFLPPSSRYNNKRSGKMLVDIRERRAGLPQQLMTLKPTKT
jgi:hypothetical protein